MICLQDFIVQLFRDLIDNQQWSDSGSVSERVLRSYLLLFATVRNYPPALAKATKLFSEWKDSDGTMRSALLITSNHLSPFISYIFFMLFKQNLLEPNRTRDDDAITKHVYYNVPSVFQSAR